MAIVAKNKITPLDTPTVEAISRIFGDTGTGLSGSEINHLLNQCNIPDIDPQNTKWRRLHNAFADFQNKHQMANHIIRFITIAMNPASHTRNPERFIEWQTQTNRVLSLNGMCVGDDGKVKRVSQASTLKEAMERANRFKHKLESRDVHQAVINSCLAEIKSENYFHAVFESVKSISVKIRHLADLDGDGSDLYDRAFSFKEDRKPILAINSLLTETQKGEQRGFINLLKGVFGTVRNPLGHEAKIEWEISEQDALDILTVVSLIHRKLDKSTRLNQ